MQCGRCGSEKTCGCGSITVEPLTRSWDGTAREQALCGSCAKDAERRVVGLWSHPLGWELRVTINNDLLRSQAYRDPRDVAQAVK